MDNNFSIPALIPQRPPFLFIERIEELMPQNDWAVTSALWPENSLARGEDGEIKEPFIIEALAQTAALLVGAKNEAGGEPPIGYLAAAGDFHFLAPLPKNERLFFKVKTVRELGAFLVVAATCEALGSALAGGELTFYLDKNNDNS